MKNITKSKVGNIYIVKIDGKPTNIGIVRNTQAKVKGAPDWDVIDLSKTHAVDMNTSTVYFRSSSLSGAFELVSSFIASSEVKDGNVKLTK
jgi:hypothetical protein